jgi:hypothetical protein
MPGLKFRVLLHEAESELFADGYFSAVGTYAAGKDP